MGYFFSVGGCILSLLLPLPTATAKFVLFDNTKPAFDTEGRILDAHDGTIQRFHEDGPYYMHAVEYGLCQVRVVEEFLLRSGNTGGLGRNPPLNY